METSPSQSGGQGGGVRWSLQTGYPTAVTDCFHQGGSQAHWGSVQQGLLPAVLIFICQHAHKPGQSKKRAKEESLSEESRIKSSDRTAPDWTALGAFTAKRSVGWGANLSGI